MNKNELQDINEKAYSLCKRVTIEGSFVGSLAIALALQEAFEDGVEAELKRTKTSTRPKTKEECKKFLVELGTHNEDGTIHEDYK